MPLNVKIHFTGICTFAPDVPWDQHPQEVNVLIPDGGGQRGTRQWRVRNPAGKYVDLGRHAAFVRAPLAAIANAGPTELATLPNEIVWYLDKQHLEFDCDYAGDLDSTYEPDNRKSLSWLASMEQLVGAALAPVPTDVTQEKPTNADLRARVKFTKGKLAVADDGLVDEQYWEIDTVPFGPLQLRFAHKVTLCFPSVTRFKIKVRPFTEPDSALAPALVLSVPEHKTEDVELTIANLCQNPLGWCTGAPAVEDEDFRLHYQLLSSSAHGTLAARWKATGRPPGIPFPVPLSDGSGGGGVNCFPNSNP